MNRLFNWLPLAALIEKKIICMHGGIGRSINHVEQIENLQRPITMEAGSVVLMDLLWLAFLATPTVHPPSHNWYSFHFISCSDFYRSDPTENDSVEGLRPNARGPGLVTFGVGAFVHVLYMSSPFRPFSFLCSHFVVTSLIGLWSSATTMIFS
jgi:hypothetical protein